MSTVDTSEKTEVDISTDEENHEHPSDRKYMQIAGVLAILTALEVGTYFVHMPDGVLVASLMIMMVIKFFLVAAWFMHLRFDSRMFTRFFVTGIVLATTVYLLTLTIFEFWTKN
tara:strand:- start:396 stop:737 length:342 start_codon:yes stop_codon:yes gene_type:complete